MSGFESRTTPLMYRNEDEIYPDCKVLLAERGFLRDEQAREFDSPWSKLLVESLVLRDLAVTYHY